jgi:hypothetical protein
LAISTCYRRFLLNGHKDFGLLRDERLDSEDLLKPEAGLEPEDNGITLTGLSGSHSSQPFPDCVAFWEVGSIDEAGTFSSLVQAARPFQEDELPLNLPLPKNHDEMDIAVRVTDLNGATGRLSL